MTAANRYLSRVRLASNGILGVDERSLWPSKGQEIDDSVEVILIMEVGI